MPTAKLNVNNMYRMCKKNIQALLTLFTVKNKIRLGGQLLNHQGDLLMINWDEFEHIHVIKKLRQIMAQWWHIDIFFADDRGVLKNIVKGESFDHANRVNALLLNKDFGFEILSDYVANTTNDLLDSKEQTIQKEWIPGFYGILSRIVVENNFMGSVVAVGFFPSSVPKKRREELKSFLVNHNFSENDVSDALSSVKMLDDEDEIYSRELTDLVSKEIVTLHTEITSREDRINALNQELGIRYKYDAMIGKSKPMQDIYNMLDRIKSSESTVLVQGENGTGKELIAKAIHYNGPRKDNVFIAQNCSAFNDNLLDSELFGHIKGSFTGAVRDKKGLFEIAHGGTLFLDEIGDTSLAMQVKLLRVLQDGTFTPVGATDPRKVDVRLLAATNQDLKSMVEEGTFREDLYYRINIINIVVPPLRERKDDIPLLVEFFLDKTAKQKGIKSKIVTKRALEKIFDYNWPGNIRELENEIERLTVLAGDEDKITIDMLSPRIREYGEKSMIKGVKAQGKLRDAIEELEREMIREGLIRTNWNKSKLAKELGISRANLISKVNLYGMDKRRLAAKKQSLEER